MGVFPDCGCHYTTDDDGIHFCPMHAAAPELLEACKMMRDAETEEFEAGKAKYSQAALKRLEEARANVNKARVAIRAAIAAAESH